ncbi:hypothetical protein AAIB46_21985 [Streptomyces sp. 35M1]|uniref:hypothetical protein n=1 Tax=Streptomyces sp. 35M1 TaxID=3142978 RepID=UPI00399060D7
MAGLAYFLLIAAVRLSGKRTLSKNQGNGGLELVHAVVLETDGTFSVIPRSQRGSGSAPAHADWAQVREDVADRT